MDLPDTLPARLYLLSYDVRRRRMTGWMQMGYVLRAAALTDLLLAGALTDDSGKARVPAGSTVADPVLDAVLQRIAASRPRSWNHWVGKDSGSTKRAVRDQLAAGRWIRVEPRRVLGVFPVSRVTVRDTRVVKLLAARVSRALRAPVAQIEPRDAALVALAAAGELGTVLPGARRRRHKQRIAQLAVHAGPIVKSLRAVQRASTAAGG